MTQPITISRGYLQVLNSLSDVFDRPSARPCTDHVCIYCIVHTRIEGRV